MSADIAGDFDPPRSHLRTDPVDAGKIAAELEAFVGGVPADGEQVAKQAAPAVGLDRQAGDRRGVEAGQALGQDPAEVDGERRRDA